MQEIVPFADLISEEYFFLQATLEDFNRQVIEFKGWAVTVVIAALIAAHSKPITSSGRVGVIIAACSAIPFWLTESMWKVFQKMHEARVLTIERCLREQCSDVVPMQIWASWDQAFRGSSLLSSWAGVAFDLHVLVPYVFLFFGGLALPFLFPPK